MSLDHNLFEGDTRYMAETRVLMTVCEGDIVYVPVGARHQLVNDGEDWVEHLIINALPTAG